MSVHRLADYRKKPQPKPAEIPNEPRWFCVGCESLNFRILATGSIYCSGCKQLIATIRAVRT